MKSLHFRMITHQSQLPPIEKLIGLDPHQPHTIDMPYRLSSSWQDLGCEMGIWENEHGDLQAWALFNPAWWNLDYVIHPAMKDSLEKSVFTWGISQMESYAKRVGETFWGSVELFVDTPNLQQTIETLKDLGFQPFTWSTLRFEISVDDLARDNLPEGFKVRPLHGLSEVEDYVHLHRAAFDSEKMTVAWRKRTFEHPAYKPELDLVMVNSDDRPVGFCISWLWQDKGQLEPLGVHPDYQGLGLGRVLELSGLHALKELGARHAYIDHVSLNDKAIALSKQTGFRQSNDALRFYVEIS
jgi:mycothiol synthase